jgi:adenylosuccinate synthase
VVRFNGGAQAGHNVVDDSGRHHTFSTFGAGTFAGARTLISRFALVNPIAAISEARVLGRKGIANALSLLMVEDEALVTTPFHVAMNRIRELAREHRHGSCGMGIGETVQDSLCLGEGYVLRAGDLRDPAVLRAKLERIQAIKQDQVLRVLDEGTYEITPRMQVEIDVLTDPKMVETTMGYFTVFTDQAEIVGRERLVSLLRSPGTVLFEGAQGVLLDQDFGFHPYTTWSTCTFDNADTLIREADADVDVRHLGVVRAIQTRHGAGPFPTEDQAMLNRLWRDHNATGEWQGAFRAGALDLVATRYAINVAGGLDGLVVTWADAVRDGGPVCTTYDGPRGTVYAIPVPQSLNEQASIAADLFETRPMVRIIETQFPETVAEMLNVPLAMTSYGPTFNDKVTRCPI